MKKDFWLFVLIASILAVLSFIFLVYSDFFSVKTETELYLSGSYVFTAIAAVIFMASVGISPATWQGQENHKLCEMLSLYSLLFAALMALCYFGDTCSLLGFLVIIGGLLASLFTAGIIEVIVMVAATMVGGLIKKRLI